MEREGTRSQAVRPRSASSGEAPVPPPWRTEGLPKAQSANQPPGKRRGWVAWAPWVVLFGLLFGALTVQERLAGPPTVSYTDFKSQVASRNVQEVFAHGNTIQGALRQPRSLPGRLKATYQHFTTERPSFAADDLLSELARSQATVRATPLVEERGFLANLLMSVAPVLLFFGLYALMIRRQQKALKGGLGLFFAAMMRRQKELAGGPGRLFGETARKPVDPESVRVTFADVAGIDEVQAEIGEIVDFLKGPEKYRRVGARAPKGVLLAGAPGTGKTLLARATAGEAKVPFFSASASEFIEMIVGVGASRVRELFAEARKVAPAIVFIDEIDTIGRARAGGRAVSGHDEREQTLNQILTEMDGFSGREGVVVLAATNRPDVLDPALLRPGRFDRTVMVHAPDYNGREAILRVHTRRVPLAADVDVTAVAACTPGMTGADLANLVNEAALLAARRGEGVVSQRDFTNALEKVQLGTARTVVIPEEERRRTAYHEAGHALLDMLQPGADPVRKVSIIPRGRALGVTLSTPERDRYGYDANYLRGRIVGALGGMAAELEVFGVVTSGAESDLETVTRIARSMVGRWGMSEKVGAVSVLPADGGNARLAGTSTAMLDLVDQEVHRMSDSCLAEARRLLRQNRGKLDAIVAQLLENETLDEAAVYAAAGIPRSTPDRTGAAALAVTHNAGAAS